MEGKRRPCRISVTVASQIRARPIRHGMSVKPSGLSPSVLLRPVGSFVAGIRARTRLLQIISLRFACLAVLPGPNEQDSPWEPLALTTVPHRHDHLQTTIQIGDLSLRTPDPWGRACDGLEGSGGCTFLSSYNGGSPRPTPLLLCLLHLCPTNFEVTWSPSTTASSGCQSDNGCLAAIRLTGLVGACNR